MMLSIKLVLGVLGTESFCVGSILLCGLNDGDEYSVLICFMEQAVRAVVPGPKQPGDCLPLEMKPDGVTAGQFPTRILMTIAWDQSDQQYTEGHKITRSTVLYEVGTMRPEEVA